MTAFWAIWLLFGAAAAVVFDFIEMRKAVPYARFPSDISLCAVRISVAVITLLCAPVILAELLRRKLVRAAIGTKFFAGKNSTSRKRA